MSYITPEEQKASISIKGMCSQLAINLALGAGTLVIFGFLRPRNGVVYAPKQKYSSEKKQPPKIENHGLFSWVRPVMSSTDDELIEKIGLDAVMFLRFIKMCRNMFCWLFIIGLAVIATNIFGTIQDRKGFPATDNPLKYLSISYLRKKHWFWAHVAFTWIFSLLIFRFLYVQYKEYTKLKKDYFRSEEYQSSLHSRTLLITGVPTHMQSDEGLHKYIKEMLKIKQPITQAHISRKVGRLPELIKEHDQSVRKLESVLTRYLNNPNSISSKRPKHTIGGGCSGEKVDSINYYTAQIQRYEEEINHEREIIKEKKAISYGFISFTNIADAHSVAKKLEGKVHIGEPEIMLAPWPKDILWRNLTMTSAVRKTKRLTGYGIFILLCFSWLGPLTVLSSVAQLQNIVEIAPFTKKFLYSYDFITGLIEAWMSPLIMAAFFVVLPKLLRLLSKYQGKLTKSSLDRSVLSKLYLFFIINSIIIYTVSSTALDLYAKVKATIDAGNTNFKDFYKVIKEAEFLDQLADSLIKVSTFWINYISLRGVGAIFDLAQIISLIITYVKKLFVRPTPRNLKEFSRPPDFDYPVYYNIHLFFFTVGILYSVIAPLILFFCFAYFSLASLVYRYQLMYVFTTKIETGGTFWRVVFNRLIFSLIFWQSIMIGVMNLKGAHMQSLALFPLPLIAILIKIICSKRFDEQIRYYKPKTEHHNGSFNNAHHNDNISNRFGHPAFSAELITPMVHSNVKHLLRKVYNGRIDETKVRRSGMIKCMSMIKSDHNQNINIQTVEEQELDWDEQAYHEEQRPGYYVDYNDTTSVYSGTTYHNSGPPTPTTMNFPQKYQQQQYPPRNPPSELIELQHVNHLRSPPHNINYQQQGTIYIDMQ
ncbi:19995_t:CDS:2 [Funneliformis geosporum]|nr:19995_t:CDS:2 [Funneliformis geosporum]